MVTTKWAIDPVHSDIQFKVKHMMISTVTGQFKQFDATVETVGDDFSTAKINFSADVKSISTNNDQRDGHLNATDFFESEKYPQLVFVGDKLEKMDNENYQLHGTLSMRGVSKTITLAVEFGGVMVDPYGNTRAGFSIEGKLNRKDYGVNFSMISEAGSILLAEEVKIQVNAEFVKQVALATA